MMIAAIPGAVALVIVAVVGFLLVPPAVAAPVAVVVGLVVWAAVWRSATSMVLRSLQAGVATEDDLPTVSNLVDGLCASMGLPEPALFLIADDARDALALGRGPDDAVLVVTAGLANSLDPVQLEGVLAHELAHVKAGDIGPATMAAAVLLPLGFGPAASRMVHRLAGRGREFRTDQLAVEVTRYPPGLRDALVSLIESPPPQSWSTRRGGWATRWLWTVPLGGEPTEAPFGELDASTVRIAALDEW
jgi:Zn-dependent protease with chaperone function